MKAARRNVQKLSLQADLLDKIAIQYCKNCNGMALFLAKVLRSSLVVFGIGVSISLIWYALYVLHEEDYYPQRGSLAYLLKMSGLIRGVPIIEPVDEPEYYGSSGDGNKPPQSAVIYLTRNRNGNLLAMQISAYLQSVGFALDTSKDSHETLFFSQMKPIYDARFTGRGSQAVAVLISPTSGPEQLEVRIIHYE